MRSRLKAEWKEIQILKICLKEKSLRKYHTVQSTITESMEK